MAAQSKMNLELDCASFRMNDSLNSLEIYYNLYTQNSAQPTNGDSKSIKARLSLLMTDSMKSVVVAKSYNINAVVSDDTSAQRKFIGRIPYSVLPGKYLLKGVVRDMARSIDSDTFKVMVYSPVYSKTKMDISDIELATTLKSSEDTTSIFYKNTYEVLPNTGAYYGAELPVVFYYCELYNLDKNIGTEEIKLETVVFNSQNKKVISKTKVLPRSYSSIVEAGAINISKLNSGAYTLGVILVDSLKKTAILKPKKFYCYFPGRVDSTEIKRNEDGYLSSEFATMTEEELNLLFSQSQYVAKKEEVKRWATLTEINAKRKFIYNFWIIRDPNPDSAPLTYKKDYFERVDIATEKYKSMQKKGWLSDRGRVYILYGEPSEIERFPNEVDKKPYEIWHYNSLEGGAIFIFGDLTGFSDYFLIHSTMRSELRDDNWMSRLQVL